MWLMTKFGFFSVVEKPEDKKIGAATIRARVRSDLEGLREYLPQMGEIQANVGTDYPFRARALKSELAVALSKIALDIDYNNFKDVVAKKQGKSRASCYGKVWGILYELEESE
jgi:hypothetical protein